MADVVCHYICISTHALTEGDSIPPQKLDLESYFNSRPHGGRHNHFCIFFPIYYFNSRPHGGRPHPESIIPFPSTISTHALTEGDNTSAVTASYFHIFQLTPSRRATRLREGILFYRIFQLTPSRRATQQLHGFLLIIYFNSRPHGGRRNALYSCGVPFIFQLTPSRRATCRGVWRGGSQGVFQLTPSRRATLFLILFSSVRVISTHALTEGDCKFRQIFLLNRGYAYSISLYFLPHFISLLPQILSFQQKPFKFQVRIFLLFSVHLAFALQNQCVHHVKSRFCTNMFYFVFVLFTQIVKSQTISLFIYDFF